MAKVIVVDDSAYLAGEIKKFLESQGHEVLAIGKDGNEGVDLYKQHQPDLALLDLTMPNKDGRDCLSEILQYDENANVVVVSAVKDAEIIMECLMTGAKGYVEKPLKPKGARRGASLYGRKLAEYRDPGLRCLC